MCIIHLCLFFVDTCSCCARKKKSKKNPKYQFVGVLTDISNSFDVTIRLVHKLARISYRKLIVNDIRKVFFFSQLYIFYFFLHLFIFQPS